LGYLFSGNTLHMLFRKRKPKQFMIAVPEPCHEDWNKMHAVDDIRRHCDSCAKQVVDFTQMSDTELMLFFRRNQNNVCGRFTTHQVKRPMPLVIPSPQKPNGWRALLLLPFALFAKQIRAQSNDSVPVIDSTSVVESDSLAPVVDSTASVVTDSLPVDGDTLTARSPESNPQPEIINVDVVSSGSVVMIIGDVSAPYCPPPPFFESSDNHPLGVFPPIMNDESEHLNATPPGVTDKDPLAANDPAPPPAIPPDSWYEAILPVTWRMRRRS
jgi:hypothetical protein